MSDNKSKVLSVGDVVELVKDELLFRETFEKFAADDEVNAWSVAKHAQRGRKATVVEIYDDNTVTLIFSDGQELDFPISAIANNSGGAVQEEEPPLPSFDEYNEQHNNVVPVRVHEHELTKTNTGYERYPSWFCNGGLMEAGCKTAGSNGHFSVDEDRYHCAICLFDLCVPCAEFNFGRLGSDAKALELDQVMHVTTVHSHRILESVMRKPWKCLGASLPGGCKSSYPDEVVDHGKSSCYICTICPYFALCHACFDSFHVVEESQEVYNGDGVRCYASLDDAAHTDRFETRHYCGRYVGNDLYHPKPCNECNGRCGPSNGCQCQACFFVDAKPKVSKHMLSKALKRNFKEWKRSKIMIVGEGRAGKTALSNSIIGKDYENTESTIGINQLTCNVNYAALGSGNWNPCQKPDKEFESAIAENIAAIRTSKKNQLNKKKKKIANIVTLQDEEEKRIGNNKNSKPQHSQKMNSEVNVRKVAITEMEQELARPVDAPPSVDTGFVLNCLADDVQVGNLIISIFDYGGQSVFNVIHHFFLTRYGVYCLVFNMEWLAEHAGSNDHQAQDSCIAYLRFWINSIVVHTWNHETQTAAPVVLVGTRKDKVSSPAQHEKIHILLHRVFSSSCIWPFILENQNAEGSNGKMTSCFFAVDNTQSKVDPVMCQLMSTIETAMQESEYTHMNVPLTWLRALDKVTAEANSFLPLDAFTVLCESCGVKTDDVLSFLFFLNGMGNLMWHNEPNLREMVILDPIRFFVTPATIVICKHKPDDRDPNQHLLDVHKECAKKQNRKWLDLIDRGLLSHTLLPILWRDYSEHIDALVSLMVKFGLLVPLRESEKDKDLHHGVSGKKQPASSTTPAAAAPLYLVPSLLAEANVNEQKWFEDTPFCTCYFVFTASQDLPYNYTIEINDLRDQGFFPGGLFERVIGKAVEWCLQTSHTKQIRLDNVYKDLVILRYGNQLFRLSVVPHLHCIRLDISGQNPLIVFSRMQDQIQTCIQECMKALSCIPCLPFYDPSASSGNIVISGVSNTPQALSTPTESFILIPLEKIRECVQSFSEINRRHGRPLFNATMAKTLFGPWLQIYELRDEYDLFISYRWGDFDKKLARSIFDMCSNFNVGALNRALEVFLDDIRLQHGRKYQDDFTKALKGSVVALPIVTWDALERMLNHQPDSLDNVLMEWIFMLACMSQTPVQQAQSQTRIRCIFPVICGPRDKLSGRILDLFQTTILSKLPKIVPTATIEATKACLLRSEVSIKEEWLDHLTVHGVVSKILEYMGINLAQRSSYYEEVVEIDALPSSAERQASNNTLDTAETIANGIVRLLNIVNEEDEKSIQQGRRVLTNVSSAIMLQNVAATTSSAVPPPAAMLTPPAVVVATTGPVYHNTVAAEASPSKAVVETGGKTMADAMAAIKKELKIAETEKMVVALQIAMEQAGLEEECAHLTNMKEKVFYVANVLGVL